MKKRTWFLATLAAFSMALVGCDIDTLTPSVPKSTDAGSSSVERNADIERIYKLYVDNGGTLTYEQWLASIKGEPGKDGTSLRSGNGAPGTEIGQDGDSYIDVDSWDYYIKTAGSWIKLGNLKGVQGEQGPQGEKGDKGDGGVSVVSIEKTSSEGLSDTYTITYSDGTTSTFVVTNGEKGDQGIQGVPGQDGHTPVVTVGENGNWFVDGKDTGVHAQGVQGPKGDAGADGKDGSDGKSAYEIYKEAHPEYEGDEQQWLDDLVNGRLGTEEKKTYTVTFNLGYDNLSFTQEVEEGKKAKKPETPKRNGYNFVDWVDGNEDHWAFNGFSITDDITLYAVWSDPIEYTVTFLNNGGTVLDVETGHYGQTASYHGATPVAENQDPHYYYTFSGWDKDLVITGGMTVTAQYTSSYIATTAYYYDYDGETLLATVPLAEGEAPHYDGETPTRERDEVNKLQFEFEKWEKVEETGSSIKFVAKYASCTDGLDIEGDSVVYYHGVSSSVVIPSVWGGVTITRIKGKVFDGNYTVEEVLIPETVSKFDDHAFYGSRALRTITIPKLVTSLGQSIFENSGITSIVIPSSVTYLGPRAFYGCTSLKDVTILGPITSISGFCFSGCTRLESIEIPEPVASIEGWAFYNCSLLTSISLPDSLVSIGQRAFYNCNRLQCGFVVPASVTTIGAEAFGPQNLSQMAAMFCAAEYKPAGWDGSWCPSFLTVIWDCEKFHVLDGIRYLVRHNGEERYAAVAGYEGEPIDVEIAPYVDGAPVTEIGMNFYKDFAFQNCTTLTSVRLPNTMKTITYQSFSGCSSLAQVFLPDSLTKIGDYAFVGCTSLSSILIPSSVIDMGKGVFANCSKLRIFYCAQNQKPENWDEKWNQIDNFNKSPVMWDCEKTVVLNDIHYLIRHNEEGRNATIIGFEGKPENVVIPATIDNAPVVQIGINNPDYFNNAFANCKSLVSIVIPSSVTTIVSNAFSGCASLTIYCEAEAKPDGWSSSWNNSNCPVVWGYQPA